MKDLLRLLVIYKIDEEGIYPVLNRKVASKVYTSLQQLLYCFAYTSQPRQPTSTFNNLTPLPSPLKTSLSVFPTSTYQPSVQYNSQNIPHYS